MLTQCDCINVCNCSGIISDKILLAAILILITLVLLSLPTNINLEKKMGDCICLWNLMIENIVFARLIRINGDLTWELSSSRKYLMIL